MALGPRSANARSRWRPPLIPVDSIEIAQVRVTTSAAGAVAASQIYQVVGSHCERADFPLRTVNYDEGSVTFLDALPEIHTGTVPKKVYASYAEPIFADVALASDFVPPETSHSVTSTQVYGTTLWRDLLHARTGHVHRVP